MEQALTQHTLTVVARVRDVAATRAALDEVVRSKSLALDDAKLAIHFARCVLIDEASDSPYASWLVFESCFDSPLTSRAEAVRAHLTELARERGEVLSCLFGRCDGFALEADSSALAQSLLDASVRSTAEYFGHWGRDLGRIRLERQLCDEVVRCASEERGGRDAKETYQAIRKRMNAALARRPSALAALRFQECAPRSPDAQLREAKLKRPLRAWLQGGLDMFDGYVPRPLETFATLSLTPVGLPALAWAAARAATGIPFDEQRTSEERGPQSLARLLETARSEDHMLQNALTHVVPLRAGVTTKWLLRLLHRYISLVTRNHFNYVEQLGGIPSIHFAKWLLIDGGKRLLFLSNYDGSWESYLGDFVDQAALGLNLAWCLTDGYPTTYAFNWGGAHDEERFKCWARAHQRPTQLFYSAYPELSVCAINNNTWLRAGLHEGQHDVQAWLRRIT
jgi:hypothetical protein